jgi:hypothetical protein
MVLPQTILGQISIASGQADPHPGKKEKLNNKQQQKRHIAKAHIALSAKERERDNPPQNGK